MNIFNTIIGSGDVYSYTWYLWHTQKALLALKWQDIFYTSQMFFPYGGSLRYDAPIFNSIISLPFFVCCGPFASANAVIFFSFITTFIAMFLFFQQLLKHRSAAIIGATLFTFSFFRLVRLQQGSLDLISMEWIGFFLYFFLKWIIKPLEKRNIVGMVISFALQAYTDYRLFYFLCIFAVIFFFRGLILEKKIVKRKQLIISWIWFCIISFICLLPFLYLYFPVFSIAYYPNPEHYKYIRGIYSADLGAYFFPIEQSTVFIGWFSLCILLYIWICWKKIKMDYSIIRFWTVFGLSFFILSLGPTLKIFGHRIIDQPIMPFAWIMNLPIFKLSHVPYRYVIGVDLAVSVLVAYGTRSILQRISKPICRLVLLICFIVFGAIQTIIFVKIQINPNKTDVLAEHILHNPDGSVLYIPFEFFDAYRLPENYQFIYSMYHQMTHNKPILGGYLTYIDNSTYKKLHENPIFKKIKTCQNQKICESFTPEEKQELLQKFNLKYIWIGDQLAYSHVTSFFESEFSDLKIKRIDNKSTVPVYNSYPEVLLELR
jgi:hypothetical protein